MPTTANTIGIAVVENDGRYLVGLRSPDSPLAGLSEFPGGKCEPGESPQACAARECLEETGLAVLPSDLLEQRQHEYNHGTVQLHFWACRPADIKSVGDSHRNFRWVPTSELTSLNFPEANASVILSLTSK